MTTAKHPVLTIGHSTHSSEAFVALLRRHSVVSVADVRSAPYSRFNPQFNRDVLAKDLAAHGISYLFLGRELGARSDDRSCYANGRVQYARLARTDSFHRGMERVISDANDCRVALMCAEKEPLECHRTLLVARALCEAGVVVQHILPDGRLESQDTAMQRLLDLVGLPHQDLFRSHDELVAEALDLQEQRVGYVDRTMAADAAREAW